MAIYDAFTFYNEIDMLRVRLKEHSPYVDYFILVEGDMTFSGHPKKFYFNPADPRISEFSSKIISVKATLKPAPCDPWANEAAQRNAISEAADFAPDDILILSDVDEIISRHHWPTVLSIAQREEAFGIRMRTAYYYINLLTPPDCQATKLFRYRYLAERRLSMTEVRNSQLKAKPRVFEPTGEYGWHFSYIGSEDFIQNKIDSFAHQEYNNAKWNSTEKIHAAINQHQDLFGRYQRFVASPVDNTWPLEMLRNPIWKEFICTPDNFILRLRDKATRRVKFLTEGLRARV